MITTTVDVSALVDLSKVMLSLEQSDTLLREIASGMLPTTRERIHERGQKADGSQIGEYGDKYLKLRQSKYNRTADRKVILSLTGQMENDYKVIPLSDTEYALGFDNQFNADKAEWNEDRFGQVWALTDEELEGVRAIVQEFITNAFKG